MFDETAGYQVTGLSQNGQAAVLNRGHSFVCKFTSGQGSVILRDCLPILTPAQQAKIDAEAALAVRLSEAERALVETETALATATARILDLETSLATAQAEVDQTRQEAESRRDSIAEQSNEQTARIAELEADLNQMRYMAELRALVIDLEVMSVNVGLHAPDQGVILARDGLQLAADRFSDGCVLTQEMFETNALELQALIQGTWLASLGVSEEVRKLMIANDEDKLFPDELTRFHAALEAARDMGDGPTYDKGRDALRIADKAMKKLDEATEAAVMKVAEPQEDGSLRIKSVPCRRG